MIDEVESEKTKRGFYSPGFGINWKVKHRDSWYNIFAVAAKTTREYSLLSSYYLYQGSREEENNIGT